MCRNSLVSHLFVCPLCYVAGLVFVFLLHSLGKRISLFNVLLSLSLFLLPLFLFLLFFLDRLLVPLAWITPDIRKKNASSSSFCTTFKDCTAWSKQIWNKQIKSGQNIGITFWALRPHLTTHSLSSVWCASSCFLCLCPCFSFSLSASPSQLLHRCRCPPVTCTSDSSCPFRWLAVLSPGPVSQQPACEESITHSGGFSPTNTSHTEYARTSVLSEAFKVHVNM